MSCKRFSIVQRIPIVKSFYENGQCAIQTEQKLQIIFRRNETTWKSTFLSRLTTKFKTIGLFLTVHF